ncbi:hypothetical protein K378_01445 [Streptomyces sp. Amel2xB2]|uniref:hypothetical protein n=1 Tax=Streptomyces sp. Amel2xB2 TaxID=1305829 RepID=UPI000DC041E6|nr:hypothetical protein [Streptomyces sp. Amel2xB2]RAJ70280.1 hypothetical protein K378_01445 [Streptomyces sp. Amel2xB2]
MTTVVKRANTELVAVAWLRSLDGIEPGQVATTLPSKTADWAENGFLQVTPGIGGSMQLHYALREPVVQVEAYAARLDSGKPPWNVAASLMEAVVAGTYDEANLQRTLTLPGAFPAARVLTAHFVSEPRRMPDDVASYARYVADLALHWISLEGAS